MRPKVCLLVQENVLHWAPHYVDAFRRRCDVIAIGPPLDVPALEGIGRGKAAHLCQRNDRHTTATRIDEALAVLPPGWRPDLAVGIQSGGWACDRMARLQCPTAYLSVDTWHDDAEFRFARGHDFVFAAQSAFPPLMREAGLPNAHWLPLAADPDQHRPVTAIEDHDIAFVGATRFVANIPRIQRLRRLQKAFSVHVADGLGPEAMSAAFARGRIAFNSSIAGDVNMRVFETLAMGRMLLTNRDAAENGLFELFEDGVHLVTYADEDLEAAVRKHLGDREARQRIAAAGRSETLGRHTYLHRVDQMLHTIRSQAPRFGAAGDGLFRDPEAGPLAFLPHVPGVVCDMGLCLTRSRVALHRMGARKLIGVSKDPEARARRASSYDEMLAWPPSSALEGLCDTVYLSVPAAFETDFATLIRAVRRLQPPGGTLILRLSPREAELAAGGEDWWDRGVYGLGYHLVDARPGGGWFTLVLRAYRRSVRDIYDEVYARFPVPRESDLAPGP